MPGRRRRIRDVDAGASEAAASDVKAHAEDPLRTIVRRGVVVDVRHVDVVVSLKTLATYSVFVFVPRNCRGG
eukprot:1470165-Heterocapsa_arctica.AAC.1